ncbi:MAG TPA: helix-turn-helix domain-containing GNAT family N-acetyltransferase [Methylomirabilota bacterium]|nr:helix-turn-helix domain-containing GNAT family N-acetyltransferase [Methylomirabilota bacterium]
MTGRAGAPFEQRVAAVRRFNRFYTRQIGVLGDYLDSAFSLTEVRVLYELAHRERLTASQLAADLGLDPGYLSRILKAFQQRGWVQRARSTSDARRTLLTLTARGRRAFAPLEARSRGQVAGVLRRLPAGGQRRLVEALAVVEQVLGAPPAPPGALLLRAHQPGDMGWVVQRHAVVYAEEYGWNEAFEALVAEVVAEFLRGFDARRERCWIAELDGQPVGSVFLVERTKTVAQLRLLLVEPAARRLGLGRRLVDECVGFARRAGYRSVTLWTNSVLVAARRLYAAAGFRLVKSERHHSFDHDLVGETWELRLRA